MFKINEIFVSIQGEGENSGRPSLFIRVHGCDYACSWCDSKDASNWNSLSYKDYTIDQLIDEVDKLLSENPMVSSIVLTGGNPLIYDFSDLIYKFKPLYNIEVETQGSKYQSWLEEVDNITISPKNIFQNDKAVRDLHKFLSNLQNYKITWKFIYKDENDLVFINDILEEYQFAHQLIFFHFVAEDGDYKDNNIIRNKFEKMYNAIISSDLMIFRSCIRFGLQIHKILEMR